MKAARRFSLSIKILTSLPAFVEPMEAILVAAIEFTNRGPNLLALAQFSFLNAVRREMSQGYGFG